VTPPRGLIENSFDKVIITLTKRERATILAALRRWQSYPAAREADSIATNRGKHKPLDNAEIERLCKRITKIERRHDAEHPLRPSNNGVGERKGLRLSHHIRTGQRNLRKARKLLGNHR
jgi:hypothetical protein